MTAMDHIVAEARKLHNEATEKYTAGQTAYDEGNPILALHLYSEADKIIDKLDGLMLAIEIFKGKA